MAEMPPVHIIEFAVEASLQSPCQSKRGVAIFDGEYLVACGHNHKPAGFMCDGSKACKYKCSQDAVHAEQAAIIGAGRAARGCEMLHVKTVDRCVVPSMGPSCLQCSKLIIEAGITAMWLYHERGWKRYEARLFHYMSGAYMPPPMNSKAEAPHA